MKKVLKIAGITLGVLLILILVLPFAFQGKIEKLVKQEGNKMLNAQFDFSALDISLIRNFPSASITLEDFWLKGAGEFQNDTLIQAGELTAAVNLFSLFGNSGYDISKIIIEDTKVKAIVLENGHPNWDVMKPSADTTDTEETPTESAPIRIKLQKLSIKDLSVSYDDRQGGMYAAINHLNATCSGDFGSERTTVDLSMETPSLTYRTGGIPFLNKARLEADMNVDADFANNKYTLKDNTISLNAIQVNIDGWAAMQKNGIGMDMKLNTNEVGFKELLSLIPAIYAKDFQDLKTDGKASLTAFAKGILGQDQVPQFEVALDVKDGMFRYPSLPAGVENINIAANVKNAGGNIDATEITVSPFDFVLAGNPFSLKASVKTPVSDPDLQASAQGTLDLGKIKEVYPLEDMTLNGTIQADMNLAGKLSYIEKEQYDQMKAAGSIRLNNMKLNLQDMPAIDIQRSTFSFSPRYLQLSETTINIGQNDLTVDSRFENYLGYALKGSTLKGNLNISSNHIHVNDFISSDTTTVQVPETHDSTTVSSSEAGVIRIPENIDFTMQANLKEVLFDKMKLETVSGVLTVKNGTVDMRNLSFNTMGGSITANGAYSAPKGVQPHLNAGFDMKGIGFAQAYEELGLVQQLAPIFSGLKGNFSGNLKIDTPLDEKMSPVMQQVQGSGSLSTKDLSLSDVKFINQVADIVKKPSMKDIQVKDLNLDFEIADGRVTTQPFDLKLGDYTMNLSGSTGLDQTIDYTGKITLPSGGIGSKLGTVDMTIGGTFTSPKVGIDMASLAKNAAEQALKGLVKGNDENGEETKEKESVIDKALNLFKKKK
ncbi:MULTISPECIES: AsmA-like C-terminal region-containing protein [Bacteroides]|uniref:AsmA-like C-terminal region-containing protein n=1 Tax=Bacteroides TaxID=816 RepID=UPI000B3AB798|nr:MULTISPECIES: AsmA-like C-terminal region-containing protein [Bacteroides]MBM6946129.1 AsmA family protein [Bacteroides gallinaceum]OUO52426.1 AsmA family protein [Bacteroides sp. An279]